MKKMLVCLLLMALPASAGKMKEIAIMATESVEAAMGINPDFMQITDQRLVSVEGMDLAVQTKVFITVPWRDGKQEWTCLTQFVKTPQFFDVLETNCH